VEALLATYHRTRKNPETTLCQQLLSKLGVSNLSLIFIFFFSLDMAQKAKQQHLEISTKLQKQLQGRKQV